MAVVEYEEVLQTEIVAWKSTRNIDCVMEFAPRPRHIKLGMEGLLWSIEAIPVSGHDMKHYTFNIMEVKRSAGPRSLSYAERPQLPPKFEFLLVEFNISMRSVSKAKEALDKMYEFSSLFLRTEGDERWWIIVDAKIAATACTAAREAVLEAAMAAASILPPPSDNPKSSEDVDFSSKVLQKRERAIEGWTPEDELWAASFSERSPDIKQRIEFMSAATERGDVLQWCGVHVTNSPHPSFEIVVDLDQFVEGDDAVLRIGGFSNVAVRVRVSLNDDVDVVCWQKGVDTQASLGLGYLLPRFVRDYLSNAHSGDSGVNVVEGLLRRVVGYVGLLRRKCVVCGSDRLRELPLTSACKNICKARMESYDARVKKRRCESSEGGVGRREEYVRLQYPNKSEGRMALESVLQSNVVENEKRRKAAEEKAKKGRATEEVVEYEEAVRRVARMTWRSVATAVRNTMLELWKEDDVQY